MKAFELLILLIVPAMIHGQQKILNEERTYYYYAQYSDSVNNVFLKDTIQFVITKIPWKHEPGVQQTVLWKYPHAFLNSLIKGKIYSIGWLNADSTGAIENEYKFWIHPPRHNQFSLTEIAPFPTVEFPCERNKIFTSITFIGTGWGNWENLKLKNRYEFTGRVFKEIGSSDYECWIIKSESDSELGKSYLTTLFNEKIGFVGFNYCFYNNIQIRIDLIKME
jgi:hypothetical protein